MGDNQRKVVVNVSQANFSRKDGKLIAARFVDLGLAAYRRTEAEASAALRGLFRVFINELRQRGELEDRLTRLGVDWYWADEYPDDWANVEDTTEESSWTLIRHAPSSTQRTLIAA
jgi:hypothetical protein